MAQPKTTIAQPPHPGQTLATTVQERLRHDILGGKLLPGSKLVIQRLQETYGVGQNPLREALSRLTSEGLVTFADQKGFNVAPVSSAELADLTDMREQLECLALRRSIERGDAAWEGEVLAANHRLRSIPVRSPRDPEELNDDWERQHAEFHRVLISACGSPWLLHFCRVIFEQSSRYRQLLLKDERVVQIALNVYRSHDSIVEAVLARDADLAVRRLSENFVRPSDLGWTGPA